MRSCMSCLGRLIVSVVKFGVLLVLIAIGIMVYEELTKAPKPPVQNPEEAMQAIADVAAPIIQANVKSPPSYLPAVQGPAAYLPDLEQYRQVNGESVTAIMDVVGQLSAVAKTLGVPGDSGGAMKMADLLKCYQKLDVVKWRAYGQGGDAQTSYGFGIVVVADYDELKNPFNLAYCMSPFQLPTRTPGGMQTFSFEMQPCAGSYLLPAGGKTYAIAYAATIDAMCSSFCSRLPRCEELAVKYPQPQ